MNTPQAHLASSLNEGISGSVPVVAVLVVLAVISLVAIARRHGMTWSAPYLIGAGVLAAIGVFGALLLPGLASQGPGYLRGRAFPIGLTVAILATAVATFSFGSLVGLGRRPSGTAVAPDPEFTGFEPKNDVRRQRIIRAALIIAFAAVLLIILGVGGPAAVLVRGGYLQYSGPRVFMSIGNLLELVGAALVGFASVFAGPRQRAWCRIAFVALLVIAFSTGSRRLGLVPVLYWFGGLLARPSKRRFAFLPVIGLIAFTLAGMALTARKQPQSGLEPYLTFFLSNPGSVFTASASQTANALAPFAYIGYSATGEELSTHDIYVSLSPAPSGFVHYYAVASHLVFFTRHPLPALGMLFRWGGVLAVGVYMFVSGLVLGLAGRLTRRLSGRAGSIGAVVLATVSAYFCLKCTEYQLRTNSRIIWYSLALVIVVSILSIPASLRRSSRVVQHSTAVSSQATIAVVPIEDRPYRQHTTPAAIQDS